MSLPSDGLGASRVTGAFVRLVEFVMRRVVDPLALYRAKAVAQNTDGSLEVVPDEARVPGQSKVAIRYGIPGFAARLKAAGRVLVGFEEGDRRRMRALAWEDGEVAEMSLSASDLIELLSGEVKLTSGGSLPVARKGDIVSCSTLPVGLKVLITLGEVGTVGPAPMGSPLPATLIITPLQPLTGRIISGNPKIRG